MNFKSLTKIYILPPHKRDLLLKELERYIRDKLSQQDTIENKIRVAQLILEDLMAVGLDIWSMHYDGGDSESWGTTLEYGLYVWIQDEYTKVTVGYKERPRLLIEEVRAFQWNRELEDFSIKIHTDLKSYNEFLYAKLEEAKVKDEMEKNYKYELYMNEQLTDIFFSSIRF